MQEFIMGIHEYFQHILWLDLNMAPPSQKTNSDIKAKR